MEISTNGALGLAEPETDQEDDEETTVQSAKDASSSSSSSAKHRRGNKEGKHTKHVVFAEDSEVELRERLPVEESEHKRKNSGSSGNKLVTKKWDKTQGSVTVQCVRSMCEWSGGPYLIFNYLIFNI